MNIKTTLAISGMALVFLADGVAGEDWGPFVGPWKRYDKNPIIRLEGKETYSIQNGPQTVIKWKGQWHMFLMTSQPMVTKLAVSDDGLTWNRPHHEYLLKPEMDWEGGYNLAKAAVIHGDEVWLYYFGKKGNTEMIALARSKDLVHWKKEPKPIFTHRDSRVEGERAFPDCVIKEADTCITMSDGITITRRIRMATRSASPPARTASPGPTHRRARSSRFPNAPLIPGTTGWSASAA